MIKKIIAWLVLLALYFFVVAPCFSDRDNYWEHVVNAAIWSVGAAVFWIVCFVFVCLVGWAVTTICKGGKYVQRTTIRYFE